MTIARKRAIPAPAPEMSDAERIAQLEDEARLLRPYASTGGGRRMKDRLAEISAALWRLRRRPRDTPLERTPT